CFQPVQEFGYKIARDRRTVLRGRPNIVNGPDLSYRSLSCQQQEFRIDSFSFKGSFSFRQAERNGRHTSEGDVNIFDRAIREPSQTCDANLGDGLSITSSNFAGMAE